MTQYTKEQYRKIMRNDARIAFLQKLLIIVFTAMLLLQVCCEKPNSYLDFLNTNTDKQNEYPVKIEK